MNIILTIIPLIILIIAVAVLQRFFDSQSPNTASKTTSKYLYHAKSSLMTPREAVFFQTLTHIFHDKCYIFPQVHLSALLRHQVRGQSWKGAFSHINGKSVDYVLCNRETLKIICAVELDDSTHDRADRRARDAEVERILQSAGIPLVRFRHPTSMTHQQIVDHFAATLNPAKK